MHRVEPEWDGRELDHRYLCDITYNNGREEVTVQLPDIGLKRVELGNVDDKSASTWVSFLCVSSPSFGLAYFLFIILFFAFCPFCFYFF